MKEDRVPVRILLVEDSPTDALLLQEDLKLVPGANFTIVHVQRLGAALARLTATDFDLVLLDLGLPDATGPDTVTRLRRHQPHVPVVVLTGLDDEAVGTKAVQLGAQDYLIKGHCPAPMLARSIRFAIERHRSAQAREAVGDFTRCGQNVSGALSGTMNDSQR